MHFLITNQHGENRGDEAAMRAMLNAIRNRFADARFTLLYQYRDKQYRPPVDADVQCLPIIMPKRDALALAAAALLYRLGWQSARPLVGTTAKRIWSAYRQCDAVVSAPGGPYFGDLYAGHELVHTFLVWLGRLHRKPLYLFAPSCGPFSIRWLNPIRRRLFSWFDHICLREEVSALYLLNLTGIKATVTADSAFLDPFLPPQLRKQIITVTALRHRAWTTEGDAGKERQRHYEDALLETLRMLSKRGNYQFLLLPQLCGRVHSDTEYLESLGRRLGADVRWQVLDREASADEQRRIIGTASLSIATRYHHQVFSVAACTPCVAICYEHKSTGLMELAGMSSYAIGIDTVSGVTLTDIACTALDRAAEIERQLAFSRVKLRRKALKTPRMLRAGLANR